MGVIDIASSKSVWRGMEYYKQNKVLSYTVNEDGSCEGIVAGSGDGNYHVHVDMEHPRKSTCDCPLGNVLSLERKSYANILWLFHFVLMSLRQIVLKMKRQYMHQRKRNAEQRNMKSIWDLPELCHQGN